MFQIAVFISGEITLSQLTRDVLDGSFREAMHKDVLNQLKVYNSMNSQ